MSDGINKVSQSRDEQLSVEEIVRVAKRLTKRDGVENLTMRSLAEELGVSPMATYHYVPNKEELLLLVGGSVMNEVISTPVDTTTSWDEKLWQINVVLINKIGEYPGLNEFLMRHQLTDAGRRYMELSISFIRESGAPENKLSDIYSAIHTYSFGHSNLRSIYDSRPKTKPAGKHDPTLPSLRQLASLEHSEAGYRALIIGLKQQHNLK